MKPPTLVKDKKHQSVEIAGDSEYLRSTESVDKLHVFDVIRYSTWCGTCETASVKIKVLGNGASYTRTRDLLYEGLV